MEDRKLLAGVIVKVLIVAVAAFAVFSAFSEVGLAEDGTPVYVITRVLNGREWPSKRRPPVAYFEYGDQLIMTGKISNDTEWVEVYGGEPGKVWVHRNYISERQDVYTALNENYGKVKIRSKPFGKGKQTGFVARGKSVEIDQELLGWGHCERGWVDLAYFIEVCD